MKLIRLVQEFLNMAIIFKIPTGQQGIDATGANGLIGLMNNVNNYSEGLSSTPTSGTVINLIAQAPGPNVAGNMIAGLVLLNPGATGALTVNLPATSAIMAAMGASIPLDGTFAEPVTFLNNSGQTATIAAGDANTTIIGSTSIAVGSIRKFIMTPLNSSNISLTNVGVWTF